MRLLQLPFDLLGRLIAIGFRPLVILLFLAVPVLGVWTFVAAPEWGLWFPESISTYGGDIDYLFNLIMVMVVITFVGTEVVLVWCLTVERFSPQLSAFWATVFMIFIVITQRPLPLGPTCRTAVMPFDSV